MDKTDVLDEFSFQEINVNVQEMKQEPVSDGELDSEQNVNDFDYRVFEAEPQGA